MKMMFLPKIIYYFKSIPIILPDLFFKELDNLFRQVIWVKQVAKISFPILLKHKTRGGVNFPNLKNYYLVARLDQTKAWFDPLTDKLWVQIEKNVAGNRHLPSMLLSSLTNMSLSYNTLPSIESTLYAWKRLHATMPQDTMDKCIDFPLQVYEYIIPNLSTLPWLKVGILTYKELSKQPSPPSFFYIQITHLHNTNPNIHYNVHRASWSYLMSSHGRSKGL